MWGVRWCLFGEMGVSSRGGDCTYPEICMVGLLGCGGSDDVYLVKWGSVQEVGIAPTQKFVWLGCLDVGVQMMFIWRNGGVSSRGGGCTYPEICMVGVLGCGGSDDVHMEKWGVSSRGGDCTYPEICMVQLLGCEGSDDVYLEKWGSVQCRWGLHLPRICMVGLHGCGGSDDVHLDPSVGQFKRWWLHLPMKFVWFWCPQRNFEYENARN